MSNGNVIDLSQALQTTKKLLSEEEGNKVHDVLLSESGGVLGLECARCDNVYLVAWIAGLTADWVECPHCAETRARVEGEVLQVEVSTGIAK